MRRRLPALRPQEVLRALNRAGFTVHRTKGSHHHLRHSDDPRLRVSVPVHNRDLATGTLRTIIKQAGLTVEEFLEFL
jgi:predicted RNA binding protein YcfA (HicA-like mRNA interferase family)